MDRTTPEFERIVADILAVPEGWRIFTSSKAPYRGWVAKAQYHTHSPEAPFPAYFHRFEGTSEAEVIQKVLDTIRADKDWPLISNEAVVEERLREAR
jgi:hypothetical protein